MTSLGTWAPSQDISSFGSLAVTQILHLVLTMHLFASSLQLEEQEREATTNSSIMLLDTGSCCISSSPSPQQKKPKSFSFPSLNYEKPPHWVYFPLCGKTFFAK